VPAFIPIAIHKSQWPATLAAQLREALRSGEINLKFLYHSPRQVRRWLRLHEACSPARREAEVLAAYDRAFGAAAEQLGRSPVHVIGLGCGGGQKEAALIRRLTVRGSKVVFSATDVGGDLLITALRAARACLDPDHCHGLVCDLTEAWDLDEFFDPQTPPGARRLITCFGLIPGFEPRALQALLRRLLRPGDLLLGSANLAPGSDYRRGVEQVLPQYDNVLTRDWLGAFLSDVGIEPDAGTIRFCIEEAPVHSEWLRIAAIHQFHQATGITLEQKETLRFDAGTRLRLFFSYRHTLPTLRQLLAGASVEWVASWVSESGEEGVFLGRV